MKGPLCYWQQCEPADWRHSSSDAETRRPEVLLMFVGDYLKAIAFVCFGQLSGHFRATVLARRTLATMTMMTAAEAEIADFDCL